MQLIKLTNAENGEQVIFNMEAVQFISWNPNEEEGSCKIRLEGCNFYRIKETIEEIEAMFVRIGCPVVCVLDKKESRPIVYDSPLGYMVRKDMRSVRSLFPAKKTSLLEELQGQYGKAKISEIELQKKDAKEWFLQIVEELREAAVKGGRCIDWPSQKMNKGLEHWLIGEGLQIRNMYIRDSVSNSEELQYSIEYSAAKWEKFENEPIDWNMGVRHE